ncbi:MAG TPA: hypothetical protein V6D43_19220, partial [Candidatus Sericytochromatia bacterium]
NQNQGSSSTTASGGSQNQNQGSGSSDQAAYQLVGPSSRCFPGLVGLKQIPPSEVANITNENPGNAATTASAVNNTTSSPQGAAQ